MPRTGRPPRVTAVDTRREAGQRLKRAIHVARAKAGLTSDIQVSVQADVAYDTLMNWFGGRTVPRGHELRKVAKALGTTYPELQAAYEGSEPEPLPLQDAVGELVPVLRELVEELRMTRAEQTVTMELLADVLRRSSQPGAFEPDAANLAWAQEKAERDTSTRRRRPRELHPPEPR